MGLTILKLARSIDRYVAAHGLGSAVAAGEHRFEHPCVVRERGKPAAAFPHAYALLWGGWLFVLCPGGDAHTYRVSQLEELPLPRPRVSLSMGGAGQFVVLPAPASSSSAVAS